MKLGAVTFWKSLDRRTQEEPGRGVRATLRGQGYLVSGTLFSRERLDGARIFGCSFESTVPPHNLPKGVPKLDTRTQEEPGRGVLANLRGQGHLGSGIVFSRIRGRFMERLGGARILGCSFESVFPPHELPQGVRVSGPRHPDT